MLETNLESNDMGH